MTDDAYERGVAVRRDVLGVSSVEQAVARTTDFARDFQQIVIELAWETVRTRPRLDRRSRSTITLTALIARGHHEELTRHIRGALRNGLTRDEIAEVLLQTAVYCGVPDANSAFRVVQRTLDEVEEP